MSVELHLTRISPDQLARLHQHGWGRTIGALHEGRADAPDAWLLLDAHILSFMRHETPMHPTLYESVMGGQAFPDSLGRDDYPRFFGVNEVRRLADALASVSANELRARFEATRGLFGGIATGGSDEQAYTRLHERYDAVVHPYATVAQRGEVVLLLLC